MEKKELNVTFNDLPEMVKNLDDRFSKIEELLLKFVKGDFVEKDRLMTIDQICDYLPEKPAKQTIYQKICSKQIPYQKHGSRIYFSKFEIESWLNNGRRI